MKIKRYYLIFILAAAGICHAAWAEPVHDLPSLNLDLSQTTVSGLSSGAFMAVQFGIAHSSQVSGIGVTGGGLYLCAESNAILSITRCMQGNLLAGDGSGKLWILNKLWSRTQEKEKRGVIDPLSHLARQQIWAFHGNNDNTVRQPVMDALRDWYRMFAEQTPFFYKNTLPAGHGQVSAACPEQGVCQPCSYTGDNFINHCQDVALQRPYDAAGSMLQFFYGVLKRTPTSALSSQFKIFSQKPFVLVSGRRIPPEWIGLDKDGFVYIPKDCAAGQTCRLHIAFHGCEQFRAEIGDYFARFSGYNEWADAERIVVLYPQAINSNSPFNPYGCWDWWGYTDSFLSPRERYATKNGVQQEAIYRMMQHLAKNAADPFQPFTQETPALKAIDVSAAQIVLAWAAVEGAQTYYLEQKLEKGEIHESSINPPRLSFVVNNLNNNSEYQFRLQAVNVSGERQASPWLTVRTANPAASE